MKISKELRLVMKCNERPVMFYNGTQCPIGNGCGAEPPSYLYLQPKVSAGSTFQEVGTVTIPQTSVASFSELVK